MDLSPIMSHPVTLSTGHKRSIDTDDFRRLLIGTTSNASPTAVPPDPSHSTTNFAREDHPFAPVSKLAKTHEPLHVDIEQQQTQFPFAATSPGELLRLLQLRQQQNEQRQEATAQQLQIPQSSIVMPHLALLQSALQKHEEQMQKRSTVVQPPVFIESRRSEHDALRVLRERVQLDFNNTEIDGMDIDGIECQLTDLCKRCPLLAAAFMELLGDLAASSHSGLNEQTVKVKSFF